MSEKALGTMTYNQFAAIHGLVTDYDVQGHIHGGLMAAHMPNSYHKRFRKKMEELQALRTAGIDAYNAAINAGDVFAPAELSRVESLRIRASGDPDMPSTKAAARLLSKMESQSPP